MYLIAMTTTPLKFGIWSKNENFAETKGQLISKCPFGVIVSTKIPTKKFDNFCPRIFKVVKS